MAINWISALKLVPWSDVIQAAPHVVKTAKGLLKKTHEEDAAPVTSDNVTTPASPPANAGELALQHIAQLQARIVQLEQAQHTSAALMEQMAEQQAQIVHTVGLLRTGATRLAWACAVLGLCCAGLLVHALRT